MPALIPPRRPGSRRAAALLALALCSAAAAPMILPAALAQEATTEALPALLADSIFINADQTLTAEGSVEVLYKGQRLTASRLTYDQATNRLKLEGPITIDDGKGTVFLADEGDLSADFRDGILKSARLVLQDQLQIAATEIDRVGGRYTQLSRVRASTCQVCPTNPTPLWEIRAQRVVHDEEERQLYFDHAQFRIAGLPVAYFPRLRMPDPTVDRATGFLLPSIRSSSELGFGLKLPYFIAIGDSRDLTVTPYVTAKGAVSTDLRYRQAFSNGTLTLQGAYSRDDIFPDQARGYLFGDGRFTLANGYIAGFTLETVSDDSYLLDYGLDEQDRLASDVYLSRIKRDLAFDARLTHYNSLRAGDSDPILPGLVAGVSYERRFTPDLIGGQGTLRFDLLGVNRSSTSLIDSNADGVIDGRDVGRLTFGVDWRRQTVLSNGMVLGVAAGLNGALYRIGQDPTFGASVSRMTPTLAVDLRWPWVKSASGGHSSQVIEPVLQLVWSDASNTSVPNEESSLVEFDEGNLFSFSRFPGSDLYESGLRANIGVNWTRKDPDGWTLGVTAGRVLRSEDLGQFSTGSRLSGTRSDWLLAMQIRADNGLSVTNRALFDDSLEFSKNELRLSFGQQRYSLAGNYVWLVADPAEGRPLATSELALDAALRLSDSWVVTGTGRYDFTANQAARAGVGLQFRSECALVDLSLSRRFTSSTSVRPTTELSLSVNLNGFGTGSDGRQYRKSCGG